MSRVIASIGFAGLGAMGSAQAANLAKGSGLPLRVFDIDPARCQALVDQGATAVSSAPDLAAASDVLFLSLPGGTEVAELLLGERGALGALRPGSIVVDLSTIPVSLAQQLSRDARAQGCSFIDAPVTRTRKAAIEGTLSITVGADDPTVFEAVLPLLRTMATEVRLCGPPGAGAMVKILNNMVVFETVVALSEALLVARRSGLVDPRTLFDAFQAGSAQSFALGHHGMNALLPDEHPEGVFPTHYMRKDLGYAVDLGQDLGLGLPSANLALSLLERTGELGYDRSYHTAVVRALELLAPGDPPEEL